MGHLSSYSVLFIVSTFKIRYLLLHAILFSCRFSKAIYICRMSTHFTYYNFFADLIIQFFLFFVNVSNSFS